MSQQTLDRCLQMMRYLGITTYKIQSRAVYLDYGGYEFTLYLDGLLKCWYDSQWNIVTPTDGLLDAFEKRLIPACQPHADEQVRKRFRNHELKLAGLDFACQ